MDFKSLLLKWKTHIATTYLALVAQLSFSQLPEIINYTTDDYPGHSTNFSAIEDTSGVIYFGNAYSVLEFDGISWRTINTNSVSPSCFARDSSGKVYVGLFSDLGYLDKNQTGQTYFVSLKSKIAPKSTSITHINNMVVHQGNVYYCSENNVFVYDGDTVITLSPPKSPSGESGVFSYMGVIDNELVVHDYVNGILKVEGTEFKESSIRTNIPQSWIVDIFKTSSHHVYIAPHTIYFENGEELSAYDIEGKPTIVRAKQLNDNQYLLATIESGILVWERNKGIIRRYDTEAGLTDNHVLFLFEDSQDNLWATLNNGISLIRINASIEYFNKLQGLEGMGYSSLYTNDTLFLGTAHGLYYSPNWSSTNHHEFSAITHRGPIRELKVLRGSKLFSDVADFYTLKGTNVTKLSIDTWNSAWDFQLIPEHDSLMICGTYADFRIYAYRNGQWVYRNTIDGFKESARMFEFDKNGTLWLVQGLTGLFRIELDQSFTKAISIENYADTYGFKSDYFNDIVKVDNQIKIATQGGVYTLGKNDTLVKDPAFSEIDNEINRLRKIQNTDDQLYFIRNERPVYIALVDGKYQERSLTPSNLKDKLVGSSEYIAKMSTGNHLIGTQQGFAIYNETKVSQSKLPSCLIRKVEVIHTDKDTVLLMGRRKGFSLPYTQNHIAIHFALPLFGNHSDTWYHTEVINENGQIVFSGRSQSPYKEYTNIHEGSYVFKVWAEINGTSCPPTTLGFVIEAPWYRSTLGYAIYSIIGLTIGILIYLRIKSRFKRQAQRLEERRLKDLEDKEAMHKAEILEIELQQKNEEMAFMALQFAEKKKFMSNITDDLKQYASKVKDKSIATELKAMARNIHLDDKDEENWENFQNHFDKTSDNFFQKLKELDPKMSESMLLMCSYVKMGKSNKEIAELLNVTLSAVEKRKSRLKERLEIDPAVSLTEFLAKL